MLLLYRSILIKWRSSCSIHLCWSVPTLTNFVKYGGKRNKLKNYEKGIQLNWILTKYSWKYNKVTFFFFFFFFWWNIKVKVKGLNSKEKILIWLLISIFWISYFLSSESDVNMTNTIPTRKKRKKIVRPRNDTWPNRF